jgi:GNAT superfamily N-acetyltransferase
MVATPWQSLGIGRKLVESVAGELSRGGAQSMLVGILEENPNWEFYERLGARHVGSRPFNWAGYETREILYG